MEFMSHEQQDSHVITWHEMRYRRDIARLYGRRFPNRVLIGITGLGPMPWTPQLHNRVMLGFAAMRMATRDTDRRCALLRRLVFIQAWLSTHQPGECPGVLWRTIEPSTP